MNDSEICNRANVTRRTGCEHDNFKLLARQIQKEGPRDSVREPRAAFWARLVETEAAITEATQELEGLSDANAETLLNSIDQARAHRNDTHRPALGTRLQTAPLSPGSP